MSEPNPEGLDQLATKVALVMADIDEVPKNGWNDFHKYEYSTDDDVMQSLRPVLAKHNLAIFHNVVGREIEWVELEDGTTLHTRVFIEITLVDGDSGQHWTTTWEGEARDTQDKGLYKAYTSGIKYWALKSFLLSADSDVETHDSSQQGGRRQSKDTREPTSGQLDYARDLANKSLWSDDKRKSLHDRINSANRSEISDLITEMENAINNHKSKDSGESKAARQIRKRLESAQQEGEDMVGDVLPAAVAYIDNWPASAWREAVAVIREFTPDDAEIKIPDEPPAAE